MSGYEIYCICRRYLRRNKPPISTYISSDEYGYYENLNEWFVREKKFSTKEMENYINVIYNNGPETFDPYDLMDEKWDEVYLEWKRTKSTKLLYFDTVKQSFIFITNFCLKKGITLDKYKKEYAIRHIRERQIDEVVAVYLKFIEKNKVNKIEKILLQSILSKYNNIVVRIRDPELNNILASSEQEMKALLKVCASSNAI